jgi:hypothetical protein
MKFHAKTQRRKGHNVIARKPFRADEAITPRIRDCFASLAMTLVFVAALAVTSQAQMQASLGGAPDSLLMGDAMDLRLTFTPPGPGRLPPGWADSLGKFELLAPPDTSALKNPTGGPLVINLKATCYEPGDQTLGPVTMHWLAADGKTISGETASFKIHIKGVVPQAELAKADTVQKPVKLLEPNRVKKLGLSFADLVPWIISILIAAGLVWGLLWYMKRRKRQTTEVIAPAIPLRPAHEIALEALDRLRDKKLFQAGRLKEYYSLLTEILRRYIEARWEIPAMESTSFQLLRDVEPKINDANLRLLLENLLSDADLAKFAKNQPDADTCQRDLEKGYILVQKTTPVAPSILAPEGEAA